MKRLEWIGSSKEDLYDFPPGARREVGYALFAAEMGGKHSKAKPLKGFHGASVLEIVENHDGDTYRAVYTVKFEEAIYVIHCFQKKSRRGIETPRNDMELIRRRLVEAKAMHDAWLEDKK